MNFIRARKHGSKRIKDWDNMPRSMSFEEAKQNFQNRFTMEHVPSWALEPMGNGRYYSPQYRTDKEWYDNTALPGELGASQGSKPCCNSKNLSWPLGPSLDKPYEIKQLDSV
jgi:hypothetical protein